MMVGERPEVYAVGEIGAMMRFPCSHSHAGIEPWITVYLLRIWNRFKQSGGKEILCPRDRKKHRGDHVKIT
ncbi:unnamed protein product [Victoria cruziana]